MEFGARDLMTLGVIVIYGVFQYRIGDWARVSLSRGQSIPSAWRILVLVAPWVIAVLYATLLLPPSPNRNVLFTDLGFLGMVAFSFVRPAEILITTENRLLRRLAITVQTLFIPLSALFLRIWSASMSLPL